MRYTQEHKETPTMRKERIALSKASMERVVPSAKEYSRKGRNSQNWSRDWE